LLITHWPAVFNLDAPRPLVVGAAELIAADMRTRGITGGGRVRQREGYRRWLEEKRRAAANTQ